MSDRDLLNEMRNLTDALRSFVDHEKMISVKTVDELKAIRDALKTLSDAVNNVADQLPPWDAK